MQANGLSLMVWHYNTNHVFGMWVMAPYTRSLVFLQGSAGVDDVHLPVRPTLYSYG